MTTAAMSLLDRAMDLSVDEQADLAFELLAGMDGASDPDAEEAWAREIERRARRAMAGESKGTDWSVVRARMAARLRA
jgi:putative addiction module component (TIGR02574 family)